MCLSRVGMIVEASRNLAYRVVIPHVSLLLALTAGALSSTLSVTSALVVLG